MYSPKVPSRANIHYLENEIMKWSRYATILSIYTYTIQESRMDRIHIYAPRDEKGLLGMMGSLKNYKKSWAIPPGNADRCARAFEGFLLSVVRGALSNGEDRAPGGEGSGDACREPMS